MHFNTWYLILNFEKPRFKTKQKRTLIKTSR
jgi:hypothetical protein